MSLMRRVCTRCGALAAALFVAGAAHAATYYVDVNYDGVNGASDGTIDKPWTTLGAVLAQANAADNHVVLVADGVYTEPNEEFGANGLTLTKTTTIRGGYVGQVALGGASMDWGDGTRVIRSSVIDLAGAGTRAFLNVTSSKRPTIDGFTIKNGNVTGNGGAISLSGGYGSGGRILNCLFEDNAASGNGGAVYIAGNNNGNIAEITNCLFTANQAGVGGAAYIDNYSKPYDLIDCQFYDNVATGAGGGALGVAHTSTTVLTRCLFGGNAATGASGVGGATYNAANGAALAAYQCVFSNNTAGATGTGNGGAHGGGGFSPGSLTAVNSLFHGNSGSFTIHLAGNSSGSVTLRHCTLADNTGGGVTTSHGLTVQNTILANNGGTGLSTSAGSPVIDYNNVYGHTADYAGTTSAGANDISADPLFADAANGDYTLTTTSPCVDAGANLGIAVDLDGTPRPTRNGYDMGCYEESQVVRVRNLAPVVGTTSAWLRGSLDYDAGGSCGVYVYWGSADGDTDKSGWTEIHVGDQNVGEFQAEITGLTPGAEYFFRCLASNAYDEAWADATVSFTTFSGSGVNRLWIGAGGNALASTAANWFGGAVPTSDDFILLDSSPSNLTWDAAAPQTVGGWTQTENYTGTVTFATTYSTFSTVFTTFTVTGDVVLMRGIWTHQGHSLSTENSDATRRYRLRVTVGGDLTLGALAKIDLFGRGLVNNNIAEAIRGTLGGQRSNESGGLPLLNRTTYDSLTAPQAVGRGGDWGGSNARFGGGAVWLSVAGASVIDGEILARAGTWNNTTITPRSGSGGSIWLQTGTLAGSGLIDASNGDSASMGGGGRVAVVVTNDTSFGSVLMQAFGGGSGPAAAGTVYKEHAGHGAGQGILVLDNNNQTHSLYTQPYYAYGVTLMPDAANGGPVNLNAFADVVVTNRAILGINTDTALDWSTANLRLHNRDRSFIAIRGTNNVVCPASFTVDGFTLLLDVDPVVSGNWTVTSGGRISRTFARQSTNQQLLNAYPLVPPLTLTLTGDLTVESGGEVTVQRMGYYSDAGPGRQSGNRAASHGGQGGSSDGTGGNPVYGSILFPATSGSGGSWGNANFSPAGGRMRLTVTGTTTLDGELNAMPHTANQERAAGGSIWLTTGYLTGSTGTINARGRDGALGGGGGRIAVYLTHGNDTGSVTLDARGGLHATNPGAAGTVYVEAAADEAGAGRIAVWNKDRVQYSRAVTPLVPAQALASDLPPVYGAFSDNLGGARLDISQNGRVKLTGNLAVKDIVITSGGYLETAGYTLTVDALEHHLDDPAKRGMGEDTSMVDNYANIVWTGVSPGTLILLR